MLLFIIGNIIFIADAADAPIDRVDGDDIGGGY